MEIARLPTKPLHPMPSEAHKLFFSTINPIDTRRATPQNCVLQKGTLLTKHFDFIYAAMPCPGFPELPSVVFELC